MTESNPNNGAPETLQGWVPDVADKKQLCEAMDRAFDYRGDITLTLQDGTQHTGFIFDRRTGQGLEDSVIRLMPDGSDERVQISYDRVARIEFSGKDTAHGKSWETWLKKWAVKKARGEAANLYGESAEA